MNSVTYTFAAFTWSDRHSIDQTIDLVTDHMDTRQSEALREQMIHNSSGTREVTGWTLTWVPLVKNE